MKAEPHGAEGEKSNEEGGAREENHGGGAEEAEQREGGLRRRSSVEGEAGEGKSGSPSRPGAQPRPHPG